MELYVFDKSFNLLGIIDNYSSLIWIRDYYGIGSIELHTLIDSNSLNLLRKGRIIVKEDNLEEAMYIDSIRMDNENYQTMVVSGYSIDNMIDDRFVMENQSWQGHISDVLRNFVDANAIRPINPNRIIPNLELYPRRTIPDEPEGIEAPPYGTYLSGFMKEMAIKHDLGWRIIFDRANRKYLFDIYRGPDHSIDQNVNPKLIFSTEYENIFNQTYTDSDSSLRTTILVAGVDEGVDTVKVIINDELSGFDRKELFVDARDISKEDAEGVLIPEEDYKGLLKERGLSKRKEYDTVRTFESGISVLSNLKYREDFDLGYKVTIQDDDWGLLISTRITSIEEVYENNTTDIRVNFGSIIPTIMDKLNKAVK